MAASSIDLGKLHVLVTESYTERIRQDLADNIPTDAATLSGAAKFLKDNNVTAEPASSDDLKNLREHLKEASKARKTTATLELVRKDQEALEA